MQTCTHCHLQQPFENFHKGKAYKHGYRTWCKTCMATYKKQYKEANKDKILAQQRAYDAVKNPERRDYFAKRYLDKKEHINKLNRAYRQQYPHKHTAKEMRRRLAKISRTPVWLTEDDHWMIEQTYELAAVRSKMFGFPWHVDHIIPLQGELVSGLHVPNNLQVIPWLDNVRKTNRFEVAA